MNAILITVGMIAIIAIIAITNLHAFKKGYERGFSECQEAAYEDIHEAVANGEIIIVKKGGKNDD